MARAASILFGFTVLVSCVAKAEGGNSGAAVPELMIGAIKTYSTESEAKAACARDPVVWADRYAGYYYRPKEKDYGTKGEGAFACLHDAMKNNYWDTSPLSSMAHERGRSFPFTPIVPPNWGS